MVFFHAIEGILSIIIIVAIGYFLTLKGWFNQETSRFIPKLVNYVALPSLMLWNLTSTFDAHGLLSMLYGLSVPFISMLCSCVIGFICSKLLNIPDHRRGVFLSIFFCSNSVFIGIPVNLALFGNDSLPYALLYFFINTFLFWTMGNYFISQDGKSADVKLFSLKNLRNVFSPPFVGFLTAILIILLGIQLPDVINNTAKYLGNMTTALSLLFIGTVIFGVKLKDFHFSKDILAILLGRFVISPIAVLLVASFIPLPLLMKKVFVIQSALPAMPQVTIIAKVYEADTEYAAMLTAITTIVSAAVIPIYMLML